ncbi:RNA cap guanine-N2 methyltransferase [Oceanithermus profundus DSM 14977]|uniref:RNA cap guanine-N2 methyltransferase n=1 Tax=Oceanithermus profundus (strain DSM 14977 / NBRC 100410 / VKM B-2274 / 506) TaxID=670487 RepID=E4U622_OCEP5|nr:class I SAM-dependent methyltransferase [Oceanithermus profundus]ADR35843.1 RNA cap guanine-N2 methyltransferase [Oceanithermus profundus DSM 14977]
MRRLTPEAVRFLSGPAAQAELAALAEGPLDPLTTLAALRKRWSADEAAWLYDQVRLRRKARAKFPQADALLFEAEALEQASAGPMARWRAEHVFAPYARVADLGAGIGGDALALALVGKRVLAVERDPVRAALLEHNAAALGLADRLRVVRADWRTLELDVEAAFADPARRSGGRRTVRLDAMEPPLSDLERLSGRLPAVAVKLAPALDKAELPARAGLGFVSLAGELKEALAGFGELAAPEPWAAVLPAGVRLSGPEGPERTGPVGACLYEPDPAVIRAGLVRRLAAELDAWQLDPQVAYLSADAPRSTPLARGWRVLEHGPFRQKAVAAWLAAHGAGAVEVKRRRSPIEPAVLEKKLKAALARGGPTLTLFLTRIAGRPWAVLGRPL